MAHRSRLIVMSAAFLRATVSSSVGKSAAATVPINIGQAPPLRAPT